MGWREMWSLWVMASANCASTYGPGYRVYFQQRGSVLVVLLCGGVKATQARDIVVAKMLAKEWSTPND